VTLCDFDTWGCTLAFTLDPTDLRKVFSAGGDSGGGCGVSALAVGLPNSLYLTSSGGGHFCDTWRQTGYLGVNGTWDFYTGTRDFVCVCVCVCACVRAAVMG
jgi:hypothetical protein